MRKVLNLLELILVLFGGILCAMTPFYTIWAVQSKQETKTIADVILIAVIVTLLWPLQVIVGVVGILALAVEVLWCCVITRRRKLEELLREELKAFVNRVIGPYWDNYQARKK